MKIPSLSEAIALGYPEIEHSNAMWLTEDKPGQCRGCAIGAALWTMGHRNVGEIPRKLLNEYWPWTVKNPSLHLLISDLFQRVMYEQITIEDLIACVKELEAKQGEKHEDQSQGVHGTSSSECVASRDVARAWWLQRTR